MSRGLIRVKSGCMAKFRAYSGFRTRIGGILFMIRSKSLPLLAGVPGNFGLNRRIVRVSSWTTRENRDKCPEFRDNRDIRDK